MLKIFVKSYKMMYAMGFSYNDFLIQLLYIYKCLYWWVMKTQLHHCGLCIASAMVATFKPRLNHQRYYFIIL